MSINPTKLRNGVAYDFTVVLTRTLMGVDAKGAIKNCINCAHFNEQPELCNKYLQRPPARVIAYSCDSHEDSAEIPF